MGEMPITQQQIGGEKMVHSKLPATAPKPVRFTSQAIATTWYNLAMLLLSVLSGLCWLEQ
jgi:hypothetical protein